MVVPRPSRSSPTPSLANGTWASRWGARRTRATFLARHNSGLQWWQLRSGFSRAGKLFYVWHLLWCIFNPLFKNVTHQQFVDGWLDWSSLNVFLLYIFYGTLIGIIANIWAKKLSLKLINIIFSLIRYWKEISIVTHNYFPRSHKDGNCINPITSCVLTHKQQKLQHLSKVIRTTSFC